MCFASALFKLVTASDSSHSNAVYHVWDVQREKTTERNSSRWHTAREHRQAAAQASDSPVGHVQEEGAASRVELEAQQPLELRDEDIFIRGAHAAELLHELRIQVYVHALHEHAAVPGQRRGGKF